MRQRQLHMYQGVDPPGQRASIGATNRMCGLHSSTCRWRSRSSSTANAFGGDTVVVWQVAAAISGGHLWHESLLWHRQLLAGQALSLDEPRHRRKQGQAAAIGSAICTTALPQVILQRAVLQQVWLQSSGNSSRTSIGGKLASASCVRHLWLSQAAAADDCSRIIPTTAMPGACP